MRTRWYNRTLHLNTFVLAIVAMSSALIVYGSTRANAGQLDNFKPGNIMSDLVMSNYGSMSEAQIQAFLKSKNPCNDTNVYKATLSPGYNYNIQDGHFVCMADDTFNGESAAHIIWQAAQDYRINPQVLIVLLEKEQGLVTDTWPNHIQYRSATGYGCPDTAACDEKYFGLKNQIRNASMLFRSVLDGGWTNYPVGNNYVRYNPDASCGGSTINIENRATSALYRYTPYQPNAGALAAVYGTAPCGAYGNRNFYLYFTSWFGSTQYFDEVIKIRSYLEKDGWTSPMINFGATGTAGQSKPLEAFQISANAEYSSYNSKAGWQPKVSNSMVSGLIDQGVPIQAIKINLTSPMVDKYDIWYRVHASFIGWLGWAKNGEVAGVTGGTNNVESIEVKVVPKGYESPGPTTNTLISQGPSVTSPNLQLNLSSHVQYIGWQPEVVDGMISGTTGQSRQVEALKMSLRNTTGLDGTIVYSSHIQGIGWQDKRVDSGISGTTGQSRRLEAVRISLTGELAKRYDVWYRAHVSGIGWLGWAKNYSPAGSVGMSRAVEAIETRLVPKNTLDLNQSNNFLNPSGQQIPDSYSLSFSSHVQYIGWTRDVTQAQISGTTGRSQSMEAMKFSSITSDFGNISVTCSVFVKNSGWQNSVQPGNDCGTTGQSKPLESIKLSLSNELSDRYDVYYKTHVSFVGWQDWVKNGEPSGTPGSGRNIEAIIVKLVQK